jgi:hypothetical protein
MRTRTRRRPCAEERGRGLAGVLSAKCLLSFLNYRSAGSMSSVGSNLNLKSVGSILSIGSAR